MARPSRTRRTQGATACTPLSRLYSMSKTRYILAMIGRKSLTDEVAVYSEILHYFKIDSMDLNSRLRRLEETGLVTRPERGRYTITQKGMAALWQLQFIKNWKNPNIHSNILSGIEW